MECLLSNRVMKILPVYGIRINIFLRWLRDVIDPSLRNIVFKINLSIAPQRLFPAIGDDVAKLISGQPVNSINNRVVVVPLAIALFENGNDPNSVFVPTE